MQMRRRWPGVAQFVAALGTVFMAACAGDGGPTEPQVRDWIGAGKSITSDSLAAVMSSAGCLRETAVPDSTTLVLPAAGADNGALMFDCSSVARPRLDSAVVKYFSLQKASSGQAMSQWNPEGGWWLVGYKWVEYCSVDYVNDVAYCGIWVAVPYQEWIQNNPPGEPGGGVPDGPPPDTTTPGLTVVALAMSENAIEINSGVSYSGMSLMATLSNNTVIDATSLATWYTTTGAVVTSVGTGSFLAGASGAGVLKAAYGGVIVEAGVTVHADGVAPAADSLPWHEEELSDTACQRDDYQRAYCARRAPNDVERARIEAALNRMADKGGVCAAMSDTVRAMLNNGKLYMYEHVPGYRFGAFVQKNPSQVPQFIMLSAVWADKYPNKWRHTSEPERRTLQGVLAHEADHLFNRNHVDANGRMTPNSGACSDVAPVA